ncbi:MAG TPA: hypothetical protein VJZ25_03420 [Gemmatimonadaceae bacterium]|nr:hypothetical protein [Gemmatimonadaceae bacterium]
MSPYDSWKSTDTTPESEGDRREYAAGTPRYRLMFRYPRSSYLEAGQCVVACFDRFCERTRMWEQLDYGVGADEPTAIRELRSTRYEARSEARSAEFFARLRREAGRVR